MPPPVVSAESTYRDVQKVQRVLAKTAVKPTTQTKTTPPTHLTRQKPNYLIETPKSYYAEGGEYFDAELNPKEIDYYRSLGYHIEELK